MWFSIDFHSHVPVYEQIKAKIKMKILNNEIRKGEYIPSIRNLAQILGVNLNTVARAYRELEQENIIKSVRGKGYIVIGIEKKIFLDKYIEKFRRDIIQLKELRIEKNILINIIESIYNGGENND
ncbi:GntR family transcriptional regulator [Marinitoga arctica]